MRAGRSRKRRDTRLPDLDAAARLDRGRSQTRTAAPELVGLHSDVDAAHATL